MLHVSSHQEKCFIMFSEFINGIAFFLSHNIHANSKWISEISENTANSESESTLNSE